MSLYADWTQIAQSPRSHEEQNQFWNAYFAIERDAYDKLLSRADEPFKGKLTELAAEFGMEKEMSGHIFQYLGKPLFLKMRYVFFIFFI